jgi:ABC-type multidrug transport system ATPase subunit
MILSILEGVSVSIDESEVVALIGPNGAGKSIKMLDLTD